MNNEAMTVSVLHDRQAKRHYASYHCARGTFMITGTYNADEAMWAAEQFRAEHGIESAVSYSETVMKNGYTVIVPVR